MHSNNFNIGNVILFITRIRKRKKKKHRKSNHLLILFNENDFLFLLISLIKH